MKHLVIDLTRFQWQEIKPIIQQCYQFEVKKVNLIKPFIKTLIYKINKKLLYKKFILLLIRRQKIFYLTDRFYGFFFSLIKTDMYLSYFTNFIFQQIKQVDQQFQKKDLMFFKYEKAYFIQNVLFIDYKTDALDFSSGIWFNYLKKQRKQLLFLQRLRMDMREVQSWFYNSAFIICLLLSFIYFDDSEMLLKILCYFIPQIQYYIILFDMEDNKDLFINLIFYV